MKKLLVCVALSPLIIAFGADAAHAQSYTSDAARYVQEQTIMQNQNDGSFHPEMTVSREQFTVTVVDALYMNEDFDGCYRNITSPKNMDFRLLFRDVSKSRWSAKHLCVAIHAGLVDGEQDAGFHPDRAITMAEASKILAKAYGLVYPSLQATHASWYRPFMLALSTRGAIPASTRFDAPLTRAQMAQMFYMLRNQERYPLSRIVALAPAAGGSAHASTVAVAKQNTDASIAPPLPSSAHLTVATSDSLSAQATDALHHRGPSISRRMLLLKIRQGTAT